MNRSSPTQFTLFRLLFGAYLTWHFASLIPWAGELFSREGVLPEASLNLLPPFFPNPLVWFPSSGFATSWLAFLTLLSVLFALGWRRRWVALVLWFGWATLFNRNNLISNPSVPYVGVLLLFSVLIPAQEPLRLGGSPTQHADWFLPPWVTRGAWWLMAAGYTFSGITKLSSPSWVDGTAFHHLIDNPLARPNELRSLFLQLPQGVLALFTWGVLVAELTFLPLSIWKTGRLLAWTSMVVMHLGILTMVDFADLTLGMLMIHLFTFDPTWIRGTGNAREPGLLLYDGECGLCNAVVRWLLWEDCAGVLRFAPLQSAHGQAWLRRFGLDTSSFDSLVFIPAPRSRPDECHLRTQGVLGALQLLGGWGRLAGLLRVVPVKWRDAGYHLLARFRYRLFGQYVPSPLPVEDWNQRIASELSSRDAGAVGD